LMLLSLSFIIIMQRRNLPQSIKNKQKLVIERQPSIACQNGP
jgi:hypothetical protein